VYDAAETSRKIQFKKSSTVDSMLVEYWVNIDQDTNNRIGLGYACSNNPCALEAVPTEQLRFRDSSTIHATVTFPLGVWHHIAVV